MEILLFGSYIIFWIVVGLAAIVSAVSEINENGWGIAITSVIMAILLYFWGEARGIEFLFIYLKWWLIPIYMVIGLIYAYIRTYFFGKYVENRRKREKYYKSSSLKEMVFIWIFWWPTSIVILFFKDIVRWAWDGFYRFFKKQFEWIYNKGIQSVTKPD